MIAGRLDKLLRRGRALSEAPEGLRRPLVFGLLFWAVLAAVCVAYLTEDGRRFGGAPVALSLVVLTLVWLALPWNPRSGRGRKLGAPAFLVASAVVVVLTGPTWSEAFYQLVFANGVFLFGLVRRVAYSVAAMPVIVVSYLFARPEWGAGRVLGEMAWWVPSAVFMIGVSVAIVEAVRRREQTQDLLEDLGAAHAELGRYAAQVRELAVSEERARMAREMHDTIGHHLTVVSVQLEAADKTMEERPEEARERVRRARTLASDALSEVRRSVRALKPLAVQERTGVGALAALARGFQGTGLDVSFRSEGAERELPAEAQLVLYRALQEGLTNAVKHAGARRVRATLSFRGSTGRPTACLSVADDGEGAEGEVPERGFGLRGLEERAVALGGTLSAGNSAGGGFVLKVELPAGHA